MAKLDSDQLSRNVSNRGIFIILGMHRSGTSLVAGLLHRSGVIMGTLKNFMPKPNHENPKGFFENFEFRKLNDDILESSGYFVKAWNPKLKEVQASWRHRLRIKRLISKYTEQYSKWGWKDPRQMLTGEVWLRAIQELSLEDFVRLIFVYRHPLSVAKSMMTRGNVETISHGLALWFLYNQRGIQFIEDSRLPCLIFSFENIFNQTTVVRNTLAQFIDSDINKEVFDEFVSPSLNRSEYLKSDVGLNIDCDNKITQLLERLMVYEAESILKRSKEIE